MAKLTQKQRAKYRKQREDYVEENLPKWKQLLMEAVEVPGKVADCYRMFHNYSISNAMLAAFQCAQMGIECGPLRTRKHWASLGRTIKPEFLGKKQIWLCRPSGKFPVTKENKDGEKETYFIPKFDYRPWWYTLSQTEGEEYQPEDSGEWDIGNAIVGLEVEPVPFTDVNGNVMGYASGRRFAVNPLGQHQLATTMHELAHIVLGHTDIAMMIDREHLTRDQCELEAEATSMLVMDALGYTDHTESRGYIQSWFKENTIEDEVARKIFSAANQILKAGVSQ